MVKTNQNGQMFDLLAAIEDYIEQENETTRVDYDDWESLDGDMQFGNETTCEDCESIWESLSVDMQSEEETRLLAEHLAECEICRETCAMLHRAGAYEGTPFYDRMRKFEKAPESETDENWKQIAFAFNPILATIEEATVVDSTAVSGNLEAEIVFENDASDTSDDPRVVNDLDNKVDGKEIATAWDGVCASALAEIGFESDASDTSDDPRVVNDLDNKVDGKEIATAWDGVCASALTDEASNDPCVLNRRNGARSASAWESVSRKAEAFFNALFMPPKPACDGVKGLTLKSRKNRIMYVASAAIMLVAVGIFWSTPNNPEPMPGGPRGITKDGGATAEVTNVEPYLVLRKFDFGEADVVYQTGRGYFAQGEYSKAASDFRSLVDKLEGENVGGEALVVARWNLAVALIKSGKPEEAASVLETLRQTNLDDPKMKEGVTTLLNELNK
ncbi:MAG: tetratricopeptide repeat protein [Thermoguttaceae bacterium]|nr:tetratricopeptide repeat protein [Thermoguttaceae bacterium]